MKAMEETEKNPEVAPDDQNIDKIRDILFGVQVREFESNFSELEERFKKEIENLRNETRGKLGKLEEFINKEVTSLTDKFSAEQNLYRETAKKLTEEVQNVSEGLDQKLSRYVDETAKNESDIRMQILSQTKALTDSIHQKQEEVMSALERESKELRDEKADRASLADLFNEMAIRLTGDYKSPESDRREKTNDPSQ